MCHEWNTQVPDPIASKPCVGFQTSAAKQSHTFDYCLLIKANDWVGTDGNPCWGDGTISDDGNYYAPFANQLCVDPFAPDDPNYSQIKCYGMFDDPYHSCDETKQEIEECSTDN